MAQWGNTDNYTNSVLWAVTGFNATPNTGVGSNRQKFYNNVSRSAYVTNIIAGQFGVDTTEIGVGNGNVVHITVTNNGTGYTANATLTITGGGGSSAAGTGTANSTGKISSVNISNGGSSYETNPTVAVAAPSSVTFSSSAGVLANSMITFSAAASYIVGDAITYTTPGSNTVVGGLANNTTYYVESNDGTRIALTTIPGGSRITLTAKAATENHNLTGTTATAVAVVGGAKNKGVAHAGWVNRVVGTGGRAGRVQYETLVAMGSITGDGSDDSILPDSAT
jgi:hypothetical protein